MAALVAAVAFVGVQLRGEPVDEPSMPAAPVDRPMNFTDDHSLALLRTVDAIPQPPTYVVRAVYVVPQGVEPVASRVEAIRHELGVLSTWFAFESGGGRPRFGLDETGAHRVETVVLPFGVPEIDASEGGIEVIAPRVDTEIGAAQLDLLLMYVESGPPEDAPEQCGVALQEWLAAVVWLRGCPPPSSRSPFPRGATYVAAHELTHALGAATSCMPNDDGEGHVVDDPRDVLAAGPADLRRRIVLDADRDDYLGTANPDCPPITASHVWEAPVALATAPG